jgi:hypothetical protein
VTVRRFQLRVVPLLRESLGIPVLVALPGAVASLLRPRLESPLLDLALAVACFGVATAPGLWATRGRWLST